MLVPTISIEGTGDRKAEEINCSVLIVREMVMLWKSATGFMAIQGQIDREANKEPLGMQIVLGQPLRRQKNLLLFLLCRPEPRSVQTIILVS